MMFDPTKPVQTRDGRKARIICTDAGGSQLIVALISDNSGHEYPELYSKNGSFFGNELASDMDLINIPERRVMWTNDYGHGTEGRFGSRIAAGAIAGDIRLGILKLFYEDDKLVDHEYEKLK